MNALNDSRELPVNIGQRALAILWLVTSALVGTMGLIWIFNSNRRLAEALFPLYLVIWAAAFFLGRFALGTVIQRRMAGVVQPEHEGVACIPCFGSERRVYGSFMQQKSEGAQLSGLAVDSDDWVFPARVLGNSRQAMRSPMIHISGLTNDAVRAPRISLDKAEKNLWTAFAVVSADKLLQGIVTGTPSGNVEQQVLNSHLLQALLQQLFKHQQRMHSASESLQ